MIFLVSSISNYRMKTPTFTPLSLRSYIVSLYDSSSNYMKLESLVPSVAKDVKECSTVLSSGSIIGGRVNSQESDASVRSIVMGKKSFSGGSKYAGIFVALSTSKGIEKVRLVGLY